MPRKHRRRSWGSVTEKVKGRKYVLRWVENTPEGRKRRCETFYGTYREASLRLDEIHVTKSDDMPVPTMQKVYDLWYEPWLQRSNLARNTADGYRLAWSKHIRPRFGNTPVDSIKPLALQEWLLTLSNATAKSCVKVLRRMFQIASDYIEVQGPFANGRTYDLSRREATAPAVLSKEEIIDAAKKLIGSPVEAPFMLAAMGGCRTGESLAVMVSEVSLIEHDGLTVAAVPIKRQMPLTGDSPIGRVKNETSNRVIIVQQPWAGRLMEIAEGRMRFGTQWLADRGDGFPMDRSRLCRVWKSECKRLGIRHIPFSKLRNSWRTYMEFEDRMPWDVLETLMGHRLPGVSGAHYVKPTAEQVVRSAIESLR